MDVLASVLDRSGFLPHGVCISWSPQLLWTLVGADALIAGAYFSIPLALVSYARRRREVPLAPLVWLFSAFIFACGLTHLIDVWTVWQPDYRLAAATKAVTAIVSVATAVALWRLIPQALRIPTIGELQAVIRRLESEKALRQDAELTLADAEENLAITLAAVGAGFIATDRDGHITHFNPVAEAFTGWRAAEALGRPLREVWHREGPDDVLRTERPVDALLASGQTLQDVRRLVVISRDGRRTPVEKQAAVTRDAAGAVRGLAIIARDLTRLERGEAAMRQLAAIVESSNDAVIGSDTDGCITSWNAAAERLFDLPADAAIGRPLHETVVPPDDAATAPRLAEALQGRAQPQPFDTRWRRRDGGPIDVSVTLSPVRDARGEVTGLSSIVRDATERRVNEELRLQAVRLEAEGRQAHEANRVKSEFLANMSHELRTPLNAVIGFADILHAGIVSPASDKGREYLHHIRSSGRHLLQLINDVLDLSKIESGRFECFPEPVEPGPLVSEVCDVLHGEALGRDVTVRSEVDPTLGTLVIDPARFKQVLYNYLSNAIKFTAAGGEVVVRLKAESGQRVRLEVEDTGIGIAPEHLGLLFQRFQQVHSGFAKAHAGTGLGLALTRRLVELQGGEVGVASTPGVGSVFHAVLPRHAETLRGPVSEPGPPWSAPWPSSPEDAGHAPSLEPRS